MWEASKAGIKNTMVNYFEDIFRSSGNLVNYEVIRAVEPMVTTEMNMVLDMAISKEEVRRATFQMQPSKAPGPDGMNSFFFQRYWSIVGKDTTEAIREF